MCVCASVVCVGVHVQNSVLTQNMICVRKLIEPRREAIKKLYCNDDSKCDFSENLSLNCRFSVNNCLCFTTYSDVF